MRVFLIFLTLLVAKVTVAGSACDEAQRFLDEKKSILKPLAHKEVIAMRVKYLKVAIKKKRHALCKKILSTLDN
jgi:hypothetical protein